MKNAFQKIFGTGHSMMVIEYLVDSRDFEFTISDVCSGTELTRKTVEKIVKTFLSSNLIYVKKVLGRTRLYAVNKKEPLMKKLLEINKTILKRQEELALKDMKEIQRGNKE